MCGIGGLIGPVAADAAVGLTLARIMQAMYHRGPDDNGVFHCAADAVALGQNRLSIIDLSSDGHQPMINPATGDVLVFNGEIYNFLELKAELQARGYAFRSKSDTEVLLLALAEWGVDCLSRLEGMYAFAFWRPKERTLWLVRDPLGIKPLYYSKLAGGRGLAFASELKALITLPGCCPQMDRGALGQFLEFGYTFEEQRTCLEGVSKVPPGHLIKLSPADPWAQTQRYYTPDLTPVTGRNIDHLADELYETMSTVMRQHLIADVPIGLLLSGGLDSSILAAFAARYTKVRTISMGFSQSTLDERPEALRVARHIGSEHEEVLITPDEVKLGLAEGVRHFDDLFADWGMISTRLLYAKCRERGLKVVIVGEGSDELFGGYGMFRQTEGQSTMWWLGKLYRNYSGRRWGRYFGEFQAIMREYLAATDGDRFGAIRLFESRQQLPNNYVQKVDKASMSVSVEARVPFLDRRVAAIAYRTPASMLLAPHSEKCLLRRMAERANLLPVETLHRRKFGGSMAASWMDEHPDWRAYARDIILADGGWTEELGLKPAMHAYFVEGKSGYRFPRAISIFSNLAWRLLLLELWSKAYKVSPRVA